MHLTYVTVVVCCPKDGELKLSRGRWGQRSLGNCEVRERERDREAQNYRKKALMTPLCENSIFYVYASRCK